MGYNGLFAEIEKRAKKTPYRRSNGLFAEIEAPPRASKGMFCFETAQNPQNVPM